MHHAYPAPLLRHIGKGKGIMLTKKQHELLLFINDRLAQDGVPPSFDEMRGALGLKSKSGIHRLITGLEERGFIRRMPHRARALEVIKLPKPSTVGKGRGTFTPSVIDGGKSVEQNNSASAATLAATAPYTELPLYGRIAAGLPIEALADTSSFVQIPPTMLGKGEHYALEVAGDSMIEAGILDGDTVIIRKTERADNGEIVVALVDNAEVTLKKWHLKGGKVALEPCNPSHETRIFPADQVRVQGRLVGLVRQY